MQGNKHGNDGNSPVTGMFASPYGPKRYKFVPVIAGVCRDKAGGEVVSGTVEFDMYDGAVDKYNAVCRQRWRYENGKWRREDWLDEVQDYSLIDLLSPANCGQLFLKNLLGELLVRPDVKLNPGDYDVI